MSAPFIELRICTADTERCLITAADEPVTIGRDTRCQVVIDNPTVAPRQARLIADANGTFILEAMAAFADIEASGGILLNGKPVLLPASLGQGETLTIAQTRLTWRNLAAAEAPTLAISRPNETMPSRQLAELAEQPPSARYEKDVEIGRGGMGKVFAANDKVLRRTVALKILRDSQDIAGQTRFIREARITGALQHPSIVPVHELNLDQNGHAFYTMKLAKGMTLLHILHDLAAGKAAARESYRLPHLLTIFQKVCDAVAFAHSQPQPVIHRDLKPENVMVGDYGEVLVMDWGAAKILDGNGDEPNEPRPETVAGGADSGLPISPAHAHNEDAQEETFVT